MDHPIAKDGFEADFTFTEKNEYHKNGVIIKPSQLTTGSGSVYLSHPGLNSQIAHGQNLYRLVDNGYLEGTYVKVYNDDGAEFYSSSNNFFVPNATYPELDEVNLYYHVDRYRNNFINTLGSVGFTQIDASAHVYYDGSDLTARFLPASPNYEIIFGDAASDPSVHNTAHEDKIIYHEYSHAIIYDKNSGIESSADEEGAISEGVPDYFAGAFTGRSKILDWKYQSTPAKQRDMNNPVSGIDSYSDYLNHPQHPDVEAHDGGEFFSAILWDLRNSAGNPTEIDILVFDALDGISSAPNFQEFLDVLLVADDAAYSGSHIPLILTTFNDWGIEPSMQTVSGTISSNTTWAGTIHITGNTTVSNSATLTILDGTEVLLDDGVRLVVSPGAKLIAEGTEQEPIEFVRADPNNAWNRVALNSRAGNSIKWSLFDGGYINLSIASKNNTIEHSTFRNATFRTMQGWHNQDGSGNASATISYCLIENSASVGFVAQYIDVDLSYTTIRDNSQAGLYVLSGTIYPFHNNLISNNGVTSTSRDGIEVKGTGTVYMHNSSMSAGYNKVVDNADDQISNYGDLVVGLVQD